MTAQTDPQDESAKDESAKDGSAKDDPAEDRPAKDEPARDEPAKDEILFFARLAADYAQRADACSSPVLAAGLRRLGVEYLELAKRFDGPREPAAAPKKRDAA